MRESEKYIDLWKKHFLLINFNLKKLKRERKVEIKFNKNDFEAVGNRINSGYSFRLDIENGKILNDISGSAVARDLAVVLLKDKETKIWLLENNVTIIMDHSFMLTFILNSLT